MYEPTGYTSNFAVNPDISFPTKNTQKGRKYARVGAMLLGVIGAVIIALTYAPSAFYTARSAGSDAVSGYLSDTAKSDYQPQAIDIKKTVYTPPYNANLSVENKLVIPSIGVDTIINEASLENFEEALRLGVWRAPDFATPVTQNKPIILAAHRFGYLKWDNDYRRQNSFYNLPKLTAGNTVEIVWRQRKYTYAIYSTQEGEEITDYSADLILYTCRDLTSSARIFVYARLLEI